MCEGGPSQAGHHPAWPPSPTHPPPLPGRARSEQFQAPQIPGPASTGEEAENFLTVLGWREGPCLEPALSVPARGKRAGLGVGLSVTGLCVFSPEPFSLLCARLEAPSSEPAHASPHLHFPSPYCNIPSGTDRCPLPTQSCPHPSPTRPRVPYSATVGKPAALGTCRGLMMASKEGGCPRPGSQILSQSHSPRDLGTGALCGQQGRAWPRWQGLAWLKSWLPPIRQMPEGGGLSREVG